MKTEFLKGLGLEQENIDKIMAENGKDVEAEKKKTDAAISERDSYKSQLETVNEKLKEFDGVDVNQLKGQIETLQKDLKAKENEYAEKEAERIFADSVTSAIKAAGGRNDKAVAALLDMDVLRKSKNQSEDIKKAIETVKSSDAYLFGTDEPFANPVGATGGSTGGTDTTLAAMRAAAGLPPAEK